jgi:hypothetical protein
LNSGNRQSDTVSVATEGGQRAASSLEVIASVVSAVMLLVPLVIFVFVNRFELQSRIFDLLRPSQHVPARLEDDPFLSVLGTTSIICLGSIFLIGGLVSAYYLLTKAILALLSGIRKR